MAATPAEPSGCQKAGCLAALVVAALFGIAILIGMCVSEPEPDVHSTEPAARSLNSVKRIFESENPCYSDLLLQKFFSSWWITCDGCDAVPLKQMTDTQESTLETHARRNHPMTEYDDLRTLSVRELCEFGAWQ